MRLRYGRSLLATFASQGCGACEKINLSAPLTMRRLTSRTRLVLAVNTETENGAPCQSARRATPGASGHVSSESGFPSPQPSKENAGLSDVTKLFSPVARISRQVFLAINRNTRSLGHGVRSCSCTV